MKLTKVEREIIEHRLEVPDAMYEACESAIEAHDPVIGVEEFDAAVRFVSHLIKGDFEPKQFTLVEWLVFEDAIEGSTLPDAADDAAGYPIDAGGISQRYCNQIRRAHNDLMERFVGKGDDILVRVEHGLDK